MATPNSHKQDGYRNSSSEDQEEYETLELLERLETLREDMEDLGVITLNEVIRRIEELHRQLDANE